MLNEILEFQAYVSEPTSETPRVQPGYLTKNHKKPDELPLMGINQILTVIARGFIFDEKYSEGFFVDGVITENAVRDTKVMLNRWCGFKKEDCSDIVKEWFKDYPEADSWLEKYWKHWFCMKKTEMEKNTKEQWVRLKEKWETNLNSEMDYTEESFSFGNIIANAIVQGPLRERYCIIRKSGDQQRIRDLNGLYGYIFEDNNETPQKKLKMLRNIVIFLILQAEHPDKQTEILMEKMRLLGWYGNDDRDGHDEVWFFEEFEWKDKPIMYHIPSDNKDYAKYGIASDYLEHFGFGLIEANQKDGYLDEYWVLRDTGYGRKHPLEIINV